MENELQKEQFVLGARGRRMHLAACPHCGGNVRRVRDIYGSYRQCIQCSREIYPNALPAIQEPAVETSVKPGEAERLIA